MNRPSGASKGSGVPLLQKTAAFRTIEGSLQRKEVNHTADLSIADFFGGFHPHFLKMDLRISDLGDINGKIDLGQIRS